MKKKIYGFVNGGSGDWWTVTALCEDGIFLASHICSSAAWGPHDIGVTSDWKHETYKKHCPEGFEVIWVVGNPKDSPEVMAAYAKHLEKGEAQKKAEAEKKTSDASDTGTVLNRGDG